MSNQDSFGRYLSKRVVDAQTRSSKIQILLGGIFTGFFALAFIMSFTDEALREHRMIYFVLTVFCAIPLFLGILKSRQIGMAKRYETIFSGDRNGVVTIQELSGQTAKAPDVILRELEALFRKGYFQNVTLQRGMSEPCVMINDAMVGERGIGFVEVHCPNCGAVSRIRAGSHGICGFCKAPITAEDPSAINR